LPEFLAHLRNFLWSHARPWKGNHLSGLYAEIREGETIWIEPYRASAFPPIKDLVVDRSAFDKIIEAGGYIVARTGSAPEANSQPVPKHDADLLMEAAACIGCGACVAACPNSSAMLFVSAKVAHLGLLPQGQAKRDSRAINMVRKMDELGFGNCRNHYECEAVCPAEVSSTFIARLNRDFAITAAKGALAV
jgi:succinate dehydrogenase / fumarate reductase iron-sulfur subunit